MKIFIPLLCLLSVTLAEPPVRDSYASAGSSHDHEHKFQRSPPQEYGSPSQTPARNFLASEYGHPKTRSSAKLSHTYGPPTELSEEYGLPNARSDSKISQEYGVPAVRNKPSQEYGVPEYRNAPSLEYGIPLTRKVSQQYGLPSNRNTPSQKYGAQKSKKTPTVLSTRNRPSQEYRIPAARSPSQEYGVPLTQSISHLSRNIDTANPSSLYGVPRTASEYGVYGAPSTRQSNSHLSRNIGIDSANPSNLYGVPSKDSEYEQYGVPRQSSSHNSRNIESNPSNLYNTPRKPSEEYGTPEPLSKSQPSSVYLPQKTSFGFNDVSPKSSYAKSLSKSGTDLSYGAPNSVSYGVPSPSSDYSQGFNDFGAKVSDSYGVPSRELSQEYGAPKTADLRTNAVASSYSSARSSPSTYGVPSTRNSGPSEVYGVPDQYDARSSQGYEYGRAGDDDDVQEPANYDFAYKVNDYITGSDFGHTESRQENRAEGTYFVVLPDGTKQVVEYEADERGFKPRISVEPADTGYENSADLADSSDGPY